MRKPDTNERDERSEHSASPWHGDIEFRTLAESIPALVFVSDANGANIYSNVQFQRYTGMAADKMLGDGWLDALHPDDREMAAATWLESWANKAPYDTRYRFRRKDGEYRWHLVRGTPVRDANNNVVRWIGSCTDVDDLMAHVSVQSEAQNILKALEKAADLIVYAKDADGQFIYANAAVLATVHQKNEAVIGKTAKDLSIENSEGQAIEDNDQLVRSSGESLTVKEQWTLAGGQTRHFRSTKVPLPLPDGTTGIAALSVDLTETMLVEEKLKEMVAHAHNRIDSLPNITWVADNSGQLIEVNQAWQDHTGLSPALGMQFEDIVSPEAKARFDDQWSFCIETGELLDVEIILQDALTGTTVKRRALAIPMDRTENGVAQRFWYGSFT